MLEAIAGLLLLIVLLLVVLNQLDLFDLSDLIDGIASLVGGVLALIGAGLVWTARRITGKRENITTPGQGPSPQRGAGTARGTGRRLRRPVADR